MLFIAVEVVDRCHFLIRKRKPEQIKILFDMLRIGGTRLIVRQTPPDPSDWRQVPGPPSGAGSLPDRRKRRPEAV